MRQAVFLIVAGFALAACANHGGDNTPPPSSSVTETIDGESAYVENCATCHETGMFGAPRENEPEDWQGRSNLWQAVLMEHAKTGFFEMPARGGKTQLPDELVEAAAEYMLEQTFPDRPKD